MSSSKLVQSLGKTLSKNEANLLGLMHSALDIEDNNRLHSFAQWLNTPDFTNAPPGNRDATHLAKMQLREPLKFHNFSSDSQNNYCGFGLKSIRAIEKGACVAQMSADMGMVSNILVDRQQSD